MRADSAQRAVLLFVLVLPWLWAWTPGPSPNVVPLLVSWACIAVASWILVGGGCGDKPVRQLVPAAWLTAACLNAAIGASQWFGFATDLPWVSNAPVGEAFGNLRQRNQLATLTSLGLLSALWFHARRCRPWHYAAVLLLAAGNAMSVSRTGLLQWALVPLLVAAWPAAGRTALWRLWGAAFAGYLAAALLLPWILRASLGTQAASLFGRVGADLGCSSRAVLWSNVLDLIAQRPWAGWGPGALDYAHYLTLYPGARFCDILDNAHNLPLHLAVEWGIPIAAGTCLAGLWLVVRQRPWADADPARQLAWGALAIIGLHSLLEYPLWYGPFQLAALLCLWLLWRGRGFSLRPSHATGAAVVALCALAYVYYGYDMVSQAYLPPQERRAGMREDPIRAAGDSVLFHDQLRFAELSITPLSRSSAARVNALATSMLVYSPEPKVIEKLIESSMMLGQEDRALWHAARYRAAFPEAYETWAARN